MGGRHPSRDMMEVGVEKKILVGHLYTQCQELFIPLSAEEFGVSKSAQ